MLFGNTGTKLPGNYVGEEISPQSPINQVAEFPSELVLLGRASVMIKGIANRLGIQWGLSDRWSKVALEAVSITNPQDVLPIWSVIRPTVGSTSTNAHVMDGRKVAGNSRIRFRDLGVALMNWLRLVKVSDGFVCVFVCL